LWIRRRWFRRRYRPQLWIRRRWFRRRCRLEETAQFQTRCRCWTTTRHHRQSRPGEQIPQGRQPVDWYQDRRH
jgi:hypothetical protein